MCLGLPRHILFYFVVQGTLRAHRWSYLAPVPRRLLTPWHSGGAVHMLWAQVPVHPPWISEGLWGALNFIPWQFRFCITVIDQVPVLPAPSPLPPGAVGPGQVGRASISNWALSLPFPRQLLHFWAAVLCAACAGSSAKSSQLTYQGLSW